MDLIVSSASSSLSSEKFISLNQMVSHCYIILDSGFPQFLEHLSKVVERGVFSLDGRSILRDIEKIANTHQYYKYNSIWSRQMETCSFIIVFMGFLGIDIEETGKLVNCTKERLFTYEEVAERLQGLQYIDGSANSSAYR